MGLVHPATATPAATGSASGAFDGFGDEMGTRGLRDPVDAIPCPSARAFVLVALATDPTGWATPKESLEALAIDRHVDALRGHHVTVASPGPPSIRAPVDGCPVASEATIFPSYAPESGQTAAEPASAVIVK